jgi:transposase
MPSQRKYPQEMRERAVRLVRDIRETEGERASALRRVSDQLGVHDETLRLWVRQDDVDTGRRGGVTTADEQRIQELEREIRELRRSNEILRSASAFFARELDPRQPKS